MTEREKPQSGPRSGTHAGARPDADPLPAAGGDAGDQAREDLPLAIPESGRRVRGKPKGAVNIRTNTAFQAGVARYGDPLLAEIAWGNMDTLTLIRDLRRIASDAGLKLGATVMDVVRFQQACRASALPYGHAKRAATDEKGDPVVPIIGIGRADQVVIGGSGRSIEAEIAARDAAMKVVDNQSLSEAVADKSQTGKSHDDASN